MLCSVMLCYVNCILFLSSLQRLCSIQLGHPFSNFCALKPLSRYLIIKIRSSLLNSIFTCHRPIVVTYENASFPQVQSALSNREVLWEVIRVLEKLGLSGYCMPKTGPGFFELRNIKQRKRCGKKPRNRLHGERMTSQWYYCIFWKTHLT